MQVIVLSILTKPFCMTGRKRTEIALSQESFYFKNLPPKILKESRECCSDIQQKLFDKVLSKNNFPDELKLPEVTPMHKNMILINLQPTNL